MHAPCPAHDTFFSGHFLALKLAAALYVVAIPISHFWLPHSLVWEIALVFLLLMLPPYAIEAYGKGNVFQTELKLATGLAVIALLGFWFGAPWMIVLAVFGHGLWDIAKHNGAGVAFFRWYVTGCVLVDFTYAAALSFYILMSGI
ncbi:MAG: hypothetical protein ABJL99_02375 [Aliishimia sp.]